MSRVDTAWLRMERPTNPMMITGVLMLDEPMTLAALKQVIQRRFLSYARFRQKPVDGPTGAYWQDDPDFDLDWHVRPSGLPGRATARRAEARAAAFRRPSPRARSTCTSRCGSSTWSRSYHGGSAIVARIHHCYADGIALVQVLLSLTDATAQHPGRPALAEDVAEEGGAAVARRVGAVERYAPGRKMLEKGMEMVQDPTLAGMLAKEGGDIAARAGYALSLPDDPPSVLRGRPGREQARGLGRAAGSWRK